jgi:hypothetical protein
MNMYLMSDLSKIIFRTAFQDKGELVFFGRHSGLDPESSDFGRYPIGQRHWIPAFAGMTRVGVFWTAYGDLNIRTRKNVFKNVKFQKVIFPKGGYSDYFGQQ